MKTIILIFLLAVSINAQSWEMLFLFDDGVTVTPVDTIPSQFTFADVTDAGVSSYNQAYIVVAGCDSTRFYPASGDTIRAGALGTKTVSPIWLGLGDTLYTFNVASASNSTATHSIIYSSDGTPLDTFSVTTVASSYDADAQAYFDEVSLSDNKKDTINTFIVMLKDSLNITNLSNRFDRLVLLANDDTTSALTSLVYPTNKAIRLSGMVFTANRGFLAATDDFINTLFDPATDGVKYQLDSCSIAFYSRNDGTTGRDMGGYNGSEDGVSLLSDLSGNSYCRMNDDAVFASASTDGSGLWMGVRSADNANEMYHNGVSFFTSTNASTSLMNFNVYLGATNFNGSATYSTDNQYAVYFMGDKFSDAEARMINNCIEWYLDAIGAGIQ